MITSNDFWIHRTNNINFWDQLKCSRSKLFSCWVKCTKMKSHNTAESLIMPVCKITVRTMTGKGAESEIDKVPLFANTLSRRVDDVTRRWSCIGWNTKKY
jgi:hypothetical protein